MKQDIHTTKNEQRFDAADLASIILALGEVVRHGSQHEPSGRRRKERRKRDSATSCVVPSSPSKHRYGLSTIRI